MDLLTAWQWFISLGVFTALGVSLVNAYSKWKASEADEPHDYAKSYQSLQQTIDGLSESLKDERQCRRQDSERLDAVLIKLKSVQYDARIYQKELKNMEARLDKTNNQLSISKEYIQYLWMVVVKLTNQLQEAGIEPGIIPDRTFRGGEDDFEDFDLDWLDDSIGSGGNT